MFKNKKDAESNGYFSLKKLLKESLIPTPRNKGIVVKNELHFDKNKTERGISLEQLDESPYFCLPSVIKAAREIESIKVLPLRKLEVCYSQTAWNERGRKPKNNAIAIKTLCYYKNLVGHINYPIYRENQTIEIKKASTEPPKAVGVLIALFTINRASKRDRDRAFNHYQNRNYRHANLSKTRKLEYYSLKDKVIEQAVADGLLNYQYHHANMAVYTGIENKQRYSFHTNLTNPNVEIVHCDQEDGFHYTESNFTKTGEVRLCDAIYTLNKYLTQAGT